MIRNGTGGHLQGCAGLHIYMCDEIEPYDGIDIQIPNAYVSAKNTIVDSCEYVTDAYDELIEAERTGT